MQKELIFFFYFGLGLDFNNEFEVRSMKNNVGTSPLRTNSLLFLRMMGIQWLLQIIHLGSNAADNFGG